MFIQLAHSNSIFLRATVFSKQVKNTDVLHLAESVASLNLELTEFVAEPSPYIVHGIHFRACQ